MIARLIFAGIVTVLLLIGLFKPQKWVQLPCPVERVDVGVIPASCREDGDVWQQS